MIKVCYHMQIQSHKLNRLKSKKDFYFNQGYKNCLLYSIDQGNSGNIQVIDNFSQNCCFEGFSSEIDNYTLLEFRKIMKLLFRYLLLQSRSLYLVTLLEWPWLLRGLNPYKVTKVATSLVVPLKKFL